MSATFLPKNVKEIRLTQQKINKQSIKNIFLYKLNKKKIIPNFFLKQKNKDFLRTKSFFMGN